MNATIKNSSDINEFAKWIDENLEVELSINIEEKKLDIQNGIYRDCLNISLVFLLVGILINAAEELRSTTESVTTITFKYQFDFQQTFTRAF
ncbi:AraC family transcriptional regulator, partial [Escherichia coli]|nr:AraC family transcriptional regulator [Escherichia coli]